MHVMTTLCAMLLLAVAGCSKTNDSADRDAASRDQPASESTDAAPADQNTEAGKTTNFQEETTPATPPPNQ